MGVEAVLMGVVNARSYVYPDRYRNIESCVYLSERPEHLREKEGASLTCPQLQKSHLEL